MPWEETEKQIRSGHKAPEDFQKDTQKTITLNEQEGIQAIIAKPNGKETLEIQSYLFSKDKGWTIEKAQEWFNKLHPTKEHLHIIMPFAIAEKILDQPLKIRGLAMSTGLSRNMNFYTPQELEAFAGKLADAPVYLEHVSAQNAVGKVTRAEWDGKNIIYEAEIYDEDTAEKIRRGLLQHVSVGADYQTVDQVNGKVPHGLFNAEMSLVAVPGISETNIQIIEKLHLKEQAYEPILSGEYTLGFYQDTAAFLPEHFSTVWLDKEKGVLAVMGKPQEQPSLQRTQAIFFSKGHWDQTSIKDWLSLHPSYQTPVTTPTLPDSNPVPSLTQKTPEPSIPVSQAAKLIE
ncbi:MAG: DUF2213 domain-containing protein [Candidatus Bathyarchaeota archaeon]|nr:DUF2213 domain-containing protein [Candidatus Bathyarchaeota archaeon]